MVEFAPDINLNIFYSGKCHGLIRRRRFAPMIYVAFSNVNHLLIEGENNG